MQDPHNLDRFVQAQRIVIHDVTNELQKGRKLGHWMWFVFPQVEGLGSSEYSRIYAIRSLHEARAFLTHEVLGPRLIGLTRTVVSHRDSTPDLIFGTIDSMKFRSSMTLFSELCPNIDVFSIALRQFYDGIPDQLTLDWLSRHIDS